MVSSVTLALIFVFGSAISAQEPSGLGRPPSAAEVRAWDIAIGPEGLELPEGSGSVGQGAVSS